MGIKLYNDVLVEFPNRLQAPLGASAQPGPGDIYVSGGILRWIDSSSTEQVALAMSGNLAGLASKSTARTNLGAQKVITYGTAEPSGGENGDIYIQHQ
jgi:hypothetical protein